MSRSISSSSARKPPSSRAASAPSPPPHTTLDSRAVEAERAVHSMEWSVERVSSDDKVDFLLSSFTTCGIERSNVESSVALLTKDERSVDSEAKASSSVYSDPGGRPRGA